jgi:hypothetical protein
MVETAGGIERRRTERLAGRQEPENTTNGRLSLTGGGSIRSVYSSGPTEIF